MPAENVTKFSDETLAEFVLIHATNIGLDVQASSTDFERKDLPSAVRAVRWNNRMEMLAKQLTQLGCFGKPSHYLQLPPRKFEAGDNPAACAKCPLSEACLIKERKEIPITSAKVASKPSKKPSIPIAASTATNGKHKKRIKTNIAAAITEAKASRFPKPKDWSDEDWRVTQEYNEKHRIDDDEPDENPRPKKPEEVGRKHMDDYILDLWENDEMERLNRRETDDLAIKIDSKQSPKTENLPPDDFDDDKPSRLEEKDDTIGHKCTPDELIEEGYPRELVETPSSEWTDEMWKLFAGLHSKGKIKPTRNNEKPVKITNEKAKRISFSELKELIARDDPGFTPHIEINGVKKPIRHYEGTILLNFILKDNTLSPEFIRKIIEYDDCEILRQAISSGDSASIHGLLRKLHSITNEIYTLNNEGNIDRLRSDYFLTLTQVNNLVASFRDQFETLSSTRQHVSGQMVEVRTPQAFKDPVNPGNIDSDGNLVTGDIGNTNNHQVQLISEAAAYTGRSMRNRSYLAVAEIAGVNVPSPDSLVMIEYEGTDTYREMNCLRLRERNVGFIVSPFNRLTEPGGFISILQDAYDNNKEKRKAARDMIKKMYLSMPDQHGIGVPIPDKYIRSCLDCNTDDCALLNIYQAFRSRIVRVGQYWNFVDTLSEFLNSDLIQNLSREICPEQKRNGKLTEELTDDQGKNPLESLEFDTIEITPETPAIAIPFILFNKHYKHKWDLVGRFHLYHDNFTSASTKIFIPLDQRSRVFESYTLGHGSDQVLTETGIDIKQQGRIRQRFFQSLTYALSDAELEKFNTMLSAYDVEPRFEEYSYEDYYRTTQIISSIDTILEIDLRALKGKIPLDNEVLLSNLQDFLSEIDIEYLSLEEALDNIGIHFNSESVNQSLRADFVNFLLGKDKGPKRLSFIYKFLFGMGIRRCSTKEGLVKRKDSLASLAEFVFDESKSSTVIEGLMHPEFKSYPRLTTVTATLNTRRLFNSALEKIGYSTSMLSYSERKRLILQNIDRITTEILKFATIATTRYPETPFGIADTSLDLRYFSDLGINEREVNDVITTAQNILAHIGLEGSRQLDGQELFSRYTLQWDKLSVDFGKQMLKVINPSIEP